MRRLLSALFTVSMVALVGGVACVPADDKDQVTPIPEQEPNNASTEATDVGTTGFYSFFGVCLTGETSDWFVANANVSGSVGASLSVTTNAPGGEASFAPGPLATISIRAADSQLLTEVLDAGPDHSVSFTSAVTSGDFFVEIGCPGDSDLYYAGTLRVP